MHNILADAIDDYSRRAAQAIETACEAAIQTGLYGVRVDWYANSVTARVDPDVPYGQRHEHHHRTLSPPT